MKDLFFPTFAPFRIIESPYLEPGKVLVVDDRTLQRSLDLFTRPKLEILDLPPADDRMRYQVTATFKAPFISCTHIPDDFWPAPRKRPTRRQRHRAAVKAALAARRVRMART